MQFPRRIGVIVLIAIALLVPSAASGADTALSLGPMRTIVVTPELLADAPLLFPLPPGSAAAPVPVRMSTAEATELGSAIPRGTTGEPVVRVVYPLADSVYVLDLDMDADGGVTARLFDIDARSSAVSELARGVARTDGDRVLSSASTADGRTAESSSEATEPLECEGCVAFTGVAGLIISLICSGTGPAGFLCAINAVIFGIGVSEACEANACRTRPARGGFMITKSVCTFAACDLGLAVYNPANGTTISIGSGISWRYPPWSWGTTKDGFPQSALHDLRYAALPLNRAGDYYSVGWTHDGSDPGFQACTSDVDISITVAWSNNTFSSTGSLPSRKPFLHGCPGQRYIVGA